MITTPHDLVFKGVFGKLEHARGELRAILPREVREALDWSQLALQPGSFVDVALSPQHTDLLYSVAWQHGGEALVYLLFEHQSSPPTEGRMAERLLRYQVRIWDRWRTEHPRERLLPMILPIVMYHGVSPWPEPRAFDALVHVPPGLRPAVEPHLVRFTYLLQDLSEISEAELRDSAMRTALGKLVGMCFKYARARSDFIEIFGRWTSVVRDVLGAPHGLDALALVLGYVVEVSEYVEMNDLQTVLERDLGPETKDAIMTAGQRLIEQGRQQGIHQGIQQATQGVLLRLLRQRFGDAAHGEVEQRIAAASIEQLQTWTDRVLSAATLADVLDS
jgi:predicted transposase YdaD